MRPSTNITVIGILIVMLVAAIAVVFHDSRRKPVTRPFPAATPQLRFDEEPTATLYPTLILPSRQVTFPVVASSSATPAL